MKKNKNPISLKRLLIISFALLIILSGISITTISYLGSRKLGFTMASQIIKENSDQVLNSVINYLERAYYVNTTLAHQIDTGELQVDTTGKESSVFEHFRHYLKLHPEFAGVYYGDESGDFLFAKKLPDNTISFRTIYQIDDQIHSTWIHEDNSWYTKGFGNSLDKLEDGYDPRKRTWYKAARKMGVNTWSDIYIFSSDNLPGITNAQPLFNEKNYLRGVVGIDMGIINISHYLNSLEISKSGKVVLLNNKKQIIAFSSNKDEVGKKLRNLSTIDEFFDPVIRESYNHYNLHKLDKNLSSFSVEDKRYVTSYVNFPSESMVDWQIGIILPEKKILGEVYSTNRTILFTAIFFIILSTIIGLKVAHSISTPLMQISQNMRKIRKFDLEGSLDIDTGLKELQEINRSFTNLKSGMRSFSKYVPSKVVARLVSLGREAVLGGERRRLTVFFSDIAGFTEISENMEPEHLVEELADYLGNLSSIIQEHNGTVDKYIGDSIMSFWNAPDDVDNHAALACEAAIQIQLYLEDFKRNNPHRTFFPTRIGINTGDVLVGNIGSTERMNYTVMGDNINLGSRLESLNKYYGTDILVSQQTKNDAGEAFAYRPIDRVRVKGKSRPILLYELIGHKKYQTKEQKTFSQLYSIGLQHYFNSDWNKSLKYFHHCLTIIPEDKPCSKIITRIEKYKVNPPPKDWDGVYIYLNK